ncbi:MAG: DUF366 family protein [Syntrophomonadaceae bacterium]
MNTLFIDKKIDYLGSQLVPHWIYRNFGILGDAAVAFIGKADVGLEAMVDLQDVMEKKPIYSPQMLHFLVEHFHNNLHLGIYQQRMLIICIKEELEKRGIQVIRQGDDLYVGGRKLSVSIATVSPVSILIHTGVNVLTAGTPLPTSGLAELGVEDVKGFAQNVMKKYSDELSSIDEARCKVRGTGIGC